MRRVAAGGSMGKWAKVEGDVVLMRLLARDELYNKRGRDEKKAKEEKK